MRVILAVGFAGLCLQGCSSSLAPVPAPGTQPAGAPLITLCDPESPPTDRAYPFSTHALDEKQRLRWYVCKLHDKANENLRQSRAWVNRSEWRDIPLLGAAATVAGLLLFGERNADHSLKKGEQEVISQIGFGAASWSTFINYLSPETARTLLRQGARGHFCMAGQGEVVLGVWEQVMDQLSTRATLGRELRELDADIAAVPGDYPKLAEIKAVRVAGYKAIELYDAQRLQLMNAHIYLSEAAWDFGIDLIAAADRKPVDVDKLIQDISDQTASIVKFAEAKDDVTAPAPDAPTGLAGDAMLASADTGIDAQAQTVEGLTRALVNGLPNVDAMVRGFETCASIALTGGDPRIVKIQSIKLD